MELRNYKPLIPKQPNFNYYYPNLYFDFINWNVIDFETVLDIGCGKGKKLIDFNFLKKTTQTKTINMIFNPNQNMPPLAA